MISQNGIFVMTDEEYHADPCDRPSLSSSLIHTLVTRSPLHAWTEHPRLNPAYVPEERKEFDFGSAAHAMLLVGGEPVALPYDNWRSKDARAARDATREAGGIPILEKDFSKILLMTNKARTAIVSCTDLGGMTLLNGKSEQVIVWQTSGSKCRAKLDWLADDRSLILDYKTTATSANPESYTRQLVNLGADIQAAWYLQAVRSLYPLIPEPAPDTKFVFLVQENEPPFACSLLGMTNWFLEMGRAKCNKAKAIWQGCMERNQWPAYPNRICWVDPPSWAQYEAPEETSNQTKDLENYFKQFGVEP